MVPTLFFSYSHADESLRDELEKHLYGLRRQGLISAWHDRRITVGSHVDNVIDSNLESADVVLLLISPDFIRSDYCYLREMSRAMERHDSGEVKVIPVILRPCDWHELPFGKLLAAPKDGKPVTTWPNIDEAFLDVVKAIKRALKEVGDSTAQNTNPATAKAPAAPSPLSPISRPNLGGGPRSSNLRVKKTFTDLDRDRFRDEGFEFIAEFFENSMRELVARNSSDGLQYKYQRVDASHFTAALYRSGRKVCKGAASVAGGPFSSNGIQYLMDDRVSDGGMNEAVSVKADDHRLYFEPFGMQSYGRDKEKLTAQGVAELFWEIFLRPLQ
jgi:hypothetical protein